jgi:hypothetical protein
MRTRREQAVVYSIVNEPYEPVTAIRAGVPLELDRILSKALAKKRYCQKLWTADQAARS